MDNHREVVRPDSDYRDEVKLTTAANNVLARNLAVPDSAEAIAEDGSISDRDGDL